MISRPSVQSLHDSGEYRFLGSFTNEELPQFVIREAGFGRVPESVPAGKKGRIRWSSIAAMVIFPSIYGLLFIFSMNKLAAESNTVPLAQILMGSVGGLLVARPIKEGIRALCFKLLGANKVGFVSSKKRRIHAYAQRFVVTLRENALVTSMSSLLITVLIGVGWVLSPGLSAFWITFTLPYILDYVEDFMLITYAWKKRKRATYIYFDLSGKRTYFFERQ